MPPSVSFVRSGRRSSAPFTVDVESPPSPACVGLLPVPCVMPPSSTVPLKMVDVRYGAGSWPASPYDIRSLPYDNQRGAVNAFVKFQATLPLGNQLRRCSGPNVDEPSLRTAAVRKS